MQKRNIRLEIRYSSSEGYILEQLCDEYNVNLSVLLRECTFSDFSEQQVIVKFTDVFQYGQIMGEVSAITKSILKEAEKTNLFSSELSKIKIVLSDIDSFYILNYRKIQSVRKRIEGAVIKDIRKNKDTYFQKYVEPKLSKENKDKDKLDKVTVILLTEEEKEIIKKISEIENVSMSTLLKNNVFKKCVTKRTVVKSYPLDEYIQEINNKKDILFAINEKSKRSILTERDINNTLGMLESIRDINKRINENILTEQKDIRREVRRILKERRESNGSSKN